MKELAKINPGQELETLTSGLSNFITKVKREVDCEGIDVNTKKGRAEIISNAFDVTKAKTGIATKIDNLIVSKEKEIEPTLKIIKVLKESKKITNKELGELSKSVRRAVTDWEVGEQKRIEDEKVRLEAEALAKEKESDYELASIEDELFDMKLAKRLEEERIEREASALRSKTAQEARDKKIADEAADKAKSDVEAEKVKAIQDKIDAEELAKQAEINRLAAEETAKQQRIQSEINRIEALKQAKAREMQAAEASKQLEIKRQEDEKAAAAAAQAKIELNKRHIGKIRKQSKEDLMEILGVPEKLAVSIVMATTKGLIRNITINY